MTKKLVFVFSLFCLTLAAGRVSACGAHMVIDPDKLGFFGGAMVRMAGLAPPEPVFDLEYPAMVKSAVGSESEVVVNYSRPFFSKNVTARLTATGNVKLLQEDIPLDDRNGAISISYELQRSGYDFITLTVTGEHKGEVIRESGRIYIRAMPKSSEQEAQVTKR